MSNELRALSKKTSLLIAQGSQIVFNFQLKKCGVSLVVKTTKTPDIISRVFVLCYLDRFSNFIFLSLPSSVLTMHFSSSIMLSIVPLAGFYMSEETGQREDLRWKLMREIVGNLCVHSDFSSGLPVSCTSSKTVF